MPAAAAPIRPARCLIELPEVLLAAEEHAVSSQMAAADALLARLTAQQALLRLNRVFEQPEIHAVWFEPGQFRSAVDVGLCLLRDPSVQLTPDPRKWKRWNREDLELGELDPVDGELQERLLKILVQCETRIDKLLRRSPHHQGATNLWSDHVFGRWLDRTSVGGVHRELAGPDRYDAWVAARCARQLEETAPEGVPVRRTEKRL